MTEHTHITGTAGELDWHYELPPNRGAKMQLLTVGRIAVHGNWYGAYGEAFIAWAPLPKRNKKLEEQLFNPGRQSPP